MLTWIKKKKSQLWEVYKPTARSHKTNIKSLAGSDGHVYNPRNWEDEAGSLVPGELRYSSKNKYPTKDFIC